MTYAEAKDQAAQKKGYRNFDQFLESSIDNRDVEGHDELCNEAAALAIASANDDGYRAGYTDAYEGRPHKFAVQKDWGDELPY